MLDEWGRAIGEQRDVGRSPQSTIRACGLPTWPTPSSGTRICATEPWQWGRDGDIPFHPNAAGHAALAARLSQLSDGAGGARGDSRAR